MNSKIKVKYPIAIKWKIAETKLQELKNSYNTCLRSDAFNIPGTDVKYYVVIFPNGNCEEHRGKTLIYFILEFKEKKEIESELFISIESANYYDERKHVCYETAGWGGMPVCKLDELFGTEKHFIVDGFMDIKVEGFMVIETNARGTLCKLVDNENILGIDLWNQETKDFTIIAEGKEIFAHKIVLSSRSPVFEAMFKPHTKEAQENKVIIPDFSFAVVEAAVKLCYHHSLVDDVPIEDMISIFQFFDKYDIQKLKVNLEKLLILEVNNNNVCRLANGSITSNAPNLGKKCAEFLEECYRQRTPVNDFDVLDKDFSHDIFKNALFQLSL